MKSFMMLFLMISSVFLVVGCASHAPGSDSMSSEIPNLPGVPESPYSSGASSETITSSELSAHDNIDDCWVAYEGKVYDVTDYLQQHPGGEGKILEYCGTSSGFESAFTGQHGTSKVAVLEKMGMYKGKLQ